MAKGYRWNSLHTKLVYTAESRALATLEVSVHLDLSQDLPLDRNYIEIEIPDDIVILEVNHEDLPTGWDDKPPTIITQIIGDDFVAQGEAAVLKVPTSIIPLESNFLINPNHQDSKKIKFKSTSPMVFDTRFKMK